MSGFHSSKQVLPLPFLDSVKEDILFQLAVSSTYMTTFAVTGGLWDVAKWGRLSP